MASRQRTADTYKAGRQQIVFLKFIQLFQ